MQFFRFLVVGVMNTVLGLALIYVAMALGSDYRAANVAGYTGGILFSYVANRSWTFGDSGEWRRSLLAWLAVASGTYAVQLGFVIGMHDAGVDVRIAQALGIPVYTVLTFLGARRFTFCNRSET